MTTINFLNALESADIIKNIVDVKLPLSFYGAELIGNIPNGIRFVIPESNLEYVIMDANSARPQSDLLFKLLHDSIILNNEEGKEVAGDFSRDATIIYKIALEHFSVETIKSALWAILTYYRENENISIDYRSDIVYEYYNQAFK